MDKIQIGSCPETMYKRVCGYINLKVLNDEDYLFIARKLENIIVKFSGTDSTADFSWLYYLADFLLLEYYFTRHEDTRKIKRKVKSPDRGQKREYLEQLKLKYTYFYCRIVEDHKDYYDTMIERCYKPVYQVTGLINEEYLYYDFITLNREFIMYELVALNNDKGNTYEKLAFCFKSFVPGWDSRRIVKVLRKKTLSRIFIEFINEYSRVSGLPQAVLLFYFYPMEEEIYKTGSGKTKLNFYFSRINIVEFLGLVRYKHHEFVKNIYEKRMNNIDKWCTRIRERNIRDMIVRMANLISVERS